MQSQITTGQGDSGSSSALNGESYPKSHPIMECVGTVDELRAHTALVRLAILQQKPDDYQAIADFLLWIIQQYFVLGSTFSDPLNQKSEYHIKKIVIGDIQKLEAEQARLEQVTPLPKAFILSAANLVAGQADVTCTVARRLERCCVMLKQAVPEFDASLIEVFLNRLSDYLYILARRLDKAL